MTAPSATPSPNRAFVEGPDASHAHAVTVKMLKGPKKPPPPKKKWVLLQASARWCLAMVQAWMPPPARALQGTSLKQLPRSSGAAG